MLIFRIYPKVKHFSPYSRLPPLSVILTCIMAVSSYLALLMLSLTPTVCSQSILNRAGRHHLEGHVSSFGPFTQNWTQLKAKDFTMAYMALHDLAFHDFSALCLTHSITHWPPCCLSYQAHTPRCLWAAINFCLEHSSSRCAHSSLPCFLSAFAQMSASQGGLS